MIKKALLILFAISGFQVFTSCFLFINCPSPRTYEVIYNNVEINAENTSGYNTSAITDTAYKNAFGINILVNFETSQIANAVLQTSLGIKSASATSCADDEYQYPDDIKWINVFITNVETEIRENANNKFGTYDHYNYEYQTIDEVMLERYEGWDGFQFELIEFDSIPNSAIFTVEVELESGIIFEDRTPVINFY